MFDQVGEEEIYRRKRGIRVSKKRYLSQENHTRISFRDVEAFLNMVHLEKPNYRKVIKIWVVYEEKPMKRVGFFSFSTFKGLQCAVESFEGTEPFKLRMDVEFVPPRDSRICSNDRCDEVPCGRCRGVDVMPLIDRL